jgi:hypothetical protein
LFELIGPDGHAAEDAEPARVGHRGHDVAAVAEGEKRKLDAVLVANLCLHQSSMDTPVTSRYGRSNASSTASRARQRAQTRSEVTASMPPH